MGTVNRINSAFLENVTGFDHMVNCVQRLCSVVDSTYSALQVSIDRQKASVLVRAIVNMTEETAVLLMLVSVTVIVGLDTSV